MRQSITTKYHGPANVRGARVSATSSGGCRIILEWDDALNTDTPLARKMDWTGTWQGGSVKAGCVFVNVDGDGFAVAPRQRAA